MRKVFLALLLFTLIPNITFGADSPPKVALEDGEYLREDYIKYIEKTFSPAAAFREFTSNATMITVNKAQQGTELILVFNFHEGGVGLLVQENGTVSIKWTGGEDLSKLLFSFENRNSFRLGFGKYEPQRYIYVGKANKYVAKKVFVGSYQGNDGRQYSFDDNFAYFGSTRFKYELNLDYAERDSGKGKLRDSFQNSETRELYEYDRNNGQIALYRTHGELGEIVDKQPFVILQKVLP